MFIEDLPSRVPIPASAAAVAPGKGRMAPIDLYADRTGWLGDACERGRTTRFGTRAGSLSPMNGSKALMATLVVRGSTRSRSGIMRVIGRPMTRGLERIFERGETSRRPYGPTGADRAPLRIFEGSERRVRPTHP